MCRYFLYVMFSFLLVAANLSATTLPGQINNYRIDQGWDQKQIAEAYSTYEGSQLMPARWFLALERSTSKQNLSSTLDDYGFTYDQNSRFPIGMVFKEDQITEHLYNEKQWVGLNCIACHTSQLSINGKSTIIEGGSSLFDIQAFENEIVKSVSATLNNKEKWNRFVSRLDGQKTAAIKTQLRNNLILFRDEFNQWSLRNHTYVDENNKKLGYGPSRIDGLGGPTNDLTCLLTPRMGDQALAKAHNTAENCLTSHAPVTIPHLWGVTENLWVQWDGAVHASLGRNWGQSTGTYGKNWFEKDSAGVPRIKSTADLDGLYKLEKLYEQLKSPTWDDLVAQGLVSKLDDKKIFAGGLIYEKKCQSCHSIQPAFTTANKFGNSYWIVPMSTPQEIGVDSHYLSDSHERTSKLPAQYNDVFRASFGLDSIDANQNVKASYYRAFVIRKMILDAFQGQQFSLEKMALYTNCRDSSIVQTVDGFKSRSLEGIGFTAPFLHNGSVESLYELLLPSVARKKQFLIGCRNYDIEKMGYDCKSTDKNIFSLNTAERGNANTGHEYGTDLNDTERYQLIEYLKSLKQPQAAPKNPNCH